MANQGPSANYEPSGWPSAPWRTPASLVKAIAFVNASWVPDRTHWPNEQPSRRGSRS